MITLTHEHASIMFYMILAALIIGAVPWHIRHESAKLFKAMMYMHNPHLSVNELEAVYAMACKIHGFKKI